MKFFSVAIVAAFVCIAVVSAAPSSSNNSLEEFSLDQIVKKADKIFQKVRCAAIVTEEVIGGDELKKYFTILKDMMQGFFIDWNMCGMTKDKKEYYKCKVMVVKEYGEMVRKVYKREIPEGALKEVFNKVKTQCFNENKLSELADATTNYIGKLVEIL